MTLAVVRPPPTVHEQGGSDGLYLLIGEEMPTSSALAMVVIWDHIQGESIDMHPLELPQRMLTEMLLEDVGLARRCMLPFVECVVKHAEHQLPLLVSWRPFHGMKIVIVVRIKQCTLTQQPWFDDMPDAAAVSLTDDETWLMQRQSWHLRQMAVLRRYAAGWTATVVELTFWLHLSSAERIQSHPARAGFSVVTSCFIEEDFAQVFPSTVEFYPVEPAPILLVLPRPHLLVIGEPLAHDIPVLCRVHAEGRPDLLSIVVDGTYPPVSVDTIFDLAKPDHRCRTHSECYVILRGERKHFWHDIDLQKGDFLVPG